MSSPDQAPADTDDTGPTPGPSPTPDPTPSPIPGPTPGPNGGLTPRPEAAAESGVVQRIAAQLVSLERLDSIPLAEHADLYQGVHAELQAALADIDRT